MDLVEVWGWGRGSGVCCCSCVCVHVNVCVCVCVCLCLCLCEEYCSTERDPGERQVLYVHAESLTSSAGDQGEFSVGHLSIGKITALRVDNVIGEMQLHAHVF